MCQLIMSLIVACNAGLSRGISLKKRLIALAFELKTHRISLSCRIVPVQYKLYEHFVSRVSLAMRVHYIYDLEATLHC